MAKSMEAVARTSRPLLDAGLTVAVLDEPGGAVPQLLISRCPGMHALAWSLWQGLTHHSEAKQAPLTRPTRLPSPVTRISGVDPLAERPRPAQSLGRTEGAALPPAPSAQG